jgi:uncharacterized protein YciI
MSEIPPGVRIETVYLVEAQYSKNAAERRPAVRAEHLARMVRLREEGTIIEAGAYSDGLTSSILLLKVDDARSALEVAQADVYVRAGVWEAIEVRPFGRVTAE